jgi:hypothetical protein
VPEPAIEAMTVQRPARLLSETPETPIPPRATSQRTNRRERGVEMRKAFLRPVAASSID